MKLWEPRTALEAIANGNHIEHYHVVTRQADVTTVAEAINAGIYAACQTGRPLPRTEPIVTGSWFGALNLHLPNPPSPHIILWLCQAPGRANYDYDPIYTGFKRDGEVIEEAIKAKVLPILLVTDRSYTLRSQAYGTLPDPDFFDPEGPNKIQAEATALGVAVIRTTQMELRADLTAVMESIHIGREHPKLLIP